MIEGGLMGRWYAGANPCPSCDKTVSYSAGRRRCIVCKTWFHEKCGYNPFRSDKRMFCEPCFKKNPVPVVKGAARAINESDKNITSLQIVVWSHIVDQDEERISRELGIPLDEVRRVGTVLRESELWKNGYLQVGSKETDPDKAGGEIMVGLILAALVADGLVERAWSVDQPTFALSEAGGTNE